MKTTNIVSDSISSREVSENAIAMSMDDSSTVFLMDMLGKLYARPALAVLREYLSNAHDAHVAKGGELPPIEIVLPHDHSKLLSIRDYGNGISEEQFSTILSRYGNSTKRDSNEFIGGFGLGAKAGFALNNEFFMTSYQNGTGLRARFYKDVKNQGYVEIVERFQTTESDGLLVEVVIPKAHLDEFTAGNIDTLMLAYGPEKTKITPAARKGRYSLLNPSQFAQLEFNDNIIGWVGRNSLKGKADSYAVIGKVVYGLDWDEIIRRGDTELSDFGIYFKYSEDTHVINLPIGSVDLPSSREEIILSERSLATLRGALANYIRTLHAHAQTEINQADYLPAMRKVARLEGDHYPNVKSFTWKGKKLGAELLASSKMFIKVAQNIRKDKFYTTPASRYESAGSFLETVLPTSTATPSKTFVVLADTEDDAKELSSNLNESVVRGLLSEIMPLRRTNKSFHSSFLVVTKDDPMYEMVSEFPVLSHSLIETELGRTEQLKRRLEERLEQERQTLLAEEAAKKVEEARMLHSFFLHDPTSRYNLGSEFYEREAPEEIFNANNSTEVKYYWSQEELLALNKSIDPAFPYEVYENRYTTMRDPESAYTDHSSIYHQKLRAFLNFFLLPGARVILLDTSVNLEDFKAQHPEVRSGVAVVKTKVEVQLKDEKSDLRALRGLRTPNYRVSAQVPEQVTRFYSMLSEEQEDQLHPDFVEIADSLEQLYRLKKQSQYMTGRYLESLLPVFSSDIPAKPDVWSKYENMEEKYPLFFFGHNFSKRVIPELIAYINMKHS